MHRLHALREISSNIYGNEGAGLKKWIVDRLREPTTWAGFSALGMVFGLPPGVVDAVGQVVGGLGALAAILMSEKAGS